MATQLGHFQAVAPCALLKNGPKIWRGSEGGLMVDVALARWQFAITCTYHFFFVPLTLGLSLLIALMEILYVRTGD